MTLTTEEWAAIVWGIDIVLYLVIGAVALGLIWWSELGPPTLDKDITESDDPTIMVVRRIALAVIWIIALWLWPLVAIGWAIDKLRDLVRRTKR